MSKTTTLCVLISGLAVVIALVFLLRPIVTLFIAHEIQYRQLSAEVRPILESVQLREKLIDEVDVVVGAYYRRVSEVGSASIYVIDGDDVNYSVDIIHSMNPARAHIGGTHTNSHIVIHLAGGFLNMGVVITESANGVSDEYLDVHLQRVSNRIWVYGFSKADVLRIRKAIGEVLE